LGLLTSPYVFDEEQARNMVKAGADIVVAHMGLTTKGTIGAHTAMSLDAAVLRVQSICDAAKSVRSDVIVLCHGGPIAEPDDVRFVLDQTQAVAGFFGASSVERLPTEQAITAQVRQFKATARRSITENGARI
jgi:predicted TIM-barrel enzyme